MTRVMGVVGIFLAVIIIPAMAHSQSFSDPSFPISITVGGTSNVGNTQYSENTTIAVADFDYATTRALYLGTSLPIKLGDVATFRLAGSITIPHTEKVEQLTPPPFRFHVRDWQGETTWGTLEGLLEYPVGLGVSFVAGFRWDSWQTSFTNPSNVYLFYPSASTDTADLTLNSYLPLLGIVSTQGGITVGAMGFPVLRGDMEVHESRNLFASNLISESSNFGEGYFVEVFTEYSTPIGLIAHTGFDGSASLFLKYNRLKAIGTNTVTQKFSGGGGAFEREIPFSFRRDLLVLGIQATINFSIPQLRSFL